MKTHLDESHKVVRHIVDHAVLCGYSARPATFEIATERFGLADTAKWISENCFDQLQYSQCNLAVRFNPVT